jgi:hypothetical protein
MTKLDAANFLLRVTLKGIKGHDTHRGYAWSAIICLDRKPVGTLEQSGTGGANRYYSTGDSASFHAFLKEFATAAQVLGMRARETADGVFAYMTPGMSAFEAVRMAADEQ